METEPKNDDTQDQQGADESVEEFKESIENDPSHNPEDEGLEEVRGG